MLMNEGLHLLAAWLKRGATFSYSHSVSYEWSSTVQQRKVHSQISWLQSYWRCAEQDKSLLPVYTRVDWWLINSQISVSLFKEKSARMVIVNGDMVIYGDIMWYMVILPSFSIWLSVSPMLGSDTISCSVVSQAIDCEWSAGSWQLVSPHAPRAKEVQEILSERLRVDTFFGMTLRTAYCTQPLWWGIGRNAL